MGIAIINFTHSSSPGSLPLICSQAEKKALSLFQIRPASAYLRRAHRSIRGINGTSDQRCFPLDLALSIVRREQMTQALSIVHREQMTQNEGAPLSRLRVMPTTSIQIQRHLARPTSLQLQSVGVEEFVPAAVMAGLEERANDSHGGPRVADPAVRGPLGSKRVIALWEVAGVKDSC